MNSSIIDSFYFGHMFGTMEIRSVFSEDRRIEAWLEAEVALARAEEACGVIPLGTAEEIAEAAKIEKLDLEAMRKGFAKAGFPIIPFVKELMKVCKPEVARWVHFGSTSQDIQDTGMAIQFRDAFTLLKSDLFKLIKVCVELIERHRSTVMAGRSFQQHAAPITFSSKVAVWLEELLRHRERLVEMLPRVLVAQCGGAVGTLASLGDRGPAVRKQFSKELGLGETATPWHAARDIPAEAVNWLALLTGTLGKIANEIAILMRTEVGEVQEPYQEGRGGSSTMPQKRNPVLCEPIIAAAHRVRELASSQSVAMIQEHERGVGHMHLEWLTIPDAFVLAAGALSQTTTLLRGLEVDPGRMRSNLQEGGGYIMAEAVMMGLAPHMGRMAAHELVSAVAHKGRKAGKTLKEALCGEPAVIKHLSNEAIDALLDPLNYTGTTQQMIDGVLEKAEKVLEPTND